MGDHVTIRFHIEYLYSAWSSGQLDAAGGRAALGWGGFEWDHYFSYEAYSFNLRWIYISTPVVEPENTPPPTIPGTQHHPAAQQTLRTLSSSRILAILVLTSSYWLTYVTLEQPTVSHNRLDNCFLAWTGSAFPGIPKFLCHVICIPVKWPVCIADLCGRSCYHLYAFTKADDVKQEPGCCTSLTFRFCPLCHPELCMSEDPETARGAGCANWCWKQSRGNKRLQDICYWALIISLWPFTLPGYTLYCICQAVISWQLNQIQWHIRIA